MYSGRPRGMRNSSLGSSAQLCEIFASLSVGKCFAEWLSLLQQSATRPTLPSIPELPFVSGGAQSYFAITPVAPGKLKPTAQRSKIGICGPSNIRNCNFKLQCE